MKAYLALFLTTFCVSSQEQNVETPAKKLNKIIGGTTANETRYPYFVQLIPIVEGKPSLCGGSLIHKNWVLSAAHCFEKVSEVHVIFNDKGGYDTDYRNILSNGHLVIKNDGKSILVHEKYGATKTRDFFRGFANTVTGKGIRFGMIAGVLGAIPRNDIALLKIPDGEHNIRRFVKLPSQASAEKQWLTVIGFGVQDKTGRLARLPSNLKKLTVPVHSDATCTSYMTKLFNGQTTLCAGILAGSKDSCQGDSGGPLMKIIGNRVIQYGIVSYGYDCGKKDLPSVYTEVHHYVDWIKQTTGGISPARNTLTSKRPAAKLTDSLKNNSFLCRHYQRKLLKSTPKSGVRGRIRAKFMDSCGIDLPAMVNFMKTLNLTESVGADPVKQSTITIASALATDVSMDTTSTAGDSTSAASD